MKRKILSLMLALGISICSLSMLSIPMSANAISLEEAQQQIEDEESNSGVDNSNSKRSSNQSNDSSRSRDNGFNQSNNSNQQSNSTNQQSSSSADFSVSEDMDTSPGITNYFRNYRPITDENMATAQKFSSPIVSFCGSLTGFILLVVGAGIFVITAFDMAYLCLPFTRNWLYAGGQAQGGMTGGMGMGMGGYGSRGGIGGFGAMSGGGGSQPASRQWVSDDAISALVEATGGGQQQSSGMGMGMGGMQSQQAPAKQVLLVYFKKRVFFMILFGVCSVILFSSVLLNCGINIAQLIFKLISAFNSAMGGAF